MEEETIALELRGVLRRLKLGPMLETLPERLVLARQRQLAYQEFLLIVLSDEAERRERAGARNRAQRGRLDALQVWERWDESTKVTYDRKLWSELLSLRFMEAHHHVLILGPVGVGKSFMANALGHIACRRGKTVLRERSEQMLKRLKASRLDNSHEAELRKLIAVDLLILDDFAIDQMDALESRDVYEIFLERHQRASIVLTSNRSPAEWLSMMSDPIRAQSAVDRLQNGAYELVIEGESYRKRQRPALGGESR
jgi:DNA replication protein DnaC